MLFPKFNLVRSVLIYITMLISGALLATLYGYIAAHYLGKAWTMFLIGAPISVLLLSLLPTLIRNIRKQTPQERLKRQADARSSVDATLISLSSPASCILLAILACSKLRSCFGNTAIPSRAKGLLGLVLGIFVSLAVTHFYYSWLKFREACQEQEQLPTR